MAKLLSLVKERKVVAEGQGSGWFVRGTRIESGALPIARPTTLHWPLASAPLLIQERSFMSLALSPGEEFRQPFFPSSFLVRPADRGERVRSLRKGLGDLDLDVPKLFL